MSNKSVIYVSPVGTNLWNMDPNKGTSAFKSNDVRDSVSKLTKNEIKSEDSRDIILDFLGPQERKESRDFRQLTEDANIDQWSHENGSEINSISTRSELIGKPPFLRDEDGALLIVSHHHSAALAALWTALTLKENKRDRIRYRHEPTLDLQDLPGNVFIVRLPNLDASESNQFNRAIQELGTIGRGLINLADINEVPVEFEFVLTGGYRATTPYVAAIAEALIGRQHAVHASMLHETSRLTPSQKLYPKTLSLTYPLRSLDLETLRLELEAIENDPTLIPNERTFLGYAYEWDDIVHEAKLTHVGKMLSEMIPIHADS